MIAQISTGPIPEAAHPEMEEVSLREESLLEQLRLPSAPIAASKGVVFTLEAAGAQTLQIAGDFKLWRPEGTELQCRKGMWRTVVPLSAVRHRHHHILDGYWQPDPLNPEVEPTPFGGYNSLPIVGDPERKAQ